ncbi:MAG: HRDC domain-containing protein [Thiomicrorhabdus chilensis]|uniref:ribonuclease D n=1 Tax=Thiomicrorhabdus chilensis TaxID=63656 RepID=UPI00299E27CC|nr:HRDC domain-containing protein [Thiomicrorhabdus chilensis]MDX1346985.1 HRDC domain-containing protein [Thiomicrorhabdus chilensis]
MQNIPYLSIQTEDELNRYSQQLLAETAIQWIAIDTEFVRTDTYFPELSLVQIQDNLGKVAIIDPIAIQKSGQLTGLIDLLCDPGLLKVFHSARQDIEVLYQLEHKMPVSIFDTQLAAIFFKHGDIAGFARVVEAEFNHKLPKTQTRTNWHARPLSEEQIQYAIDDVHYLAPLYEKFIQALTPQQLDAIRQDCEALLDESLYQPNPQQAGLKVKGIRNFKPKQLAIVYALAEWRERFAIEHNQPKKWIMSDEVIVGIAKRPPQTVEALYKVPHVKPSSVKDHGTQWIECIDQVFAAPPESWPQPQAKPAPITPQEDVMLNLCMSYCQQIALDYRINLHNLIHKSELQDLIRTSTCHSLTGWRALLVLKPLQTLLSGQADLHIEQGKVFLKSH